MKNVMNKILLIFIFYIIANVSFSGFIMKWGDLQRSGAFGFVALYEGSGYRPYVHRPLVFSIAKQINSLISEQNRQRLIHSLKKRNFTQYFSNAKIDPNYYFQYHLVYFISFTCLFASLFVLRKIGSEITGSMSIGTIAAGCFGLLFPLTDSRFFYDFPEILFFSMAVLFSLQSRWKALIIITPIATYNKESFLFFIATLLPILAINLGKIRAIFVIGISMILSGCVYLYVKSIFVNNIGVDAYYQLPSHFAHMLNYHNWFVTNIQYGMTYGYGVFLPHLLLLAWLVKCTWYKLLPAWKYHIVIALAINAPLYLLFCEPNEIRNLSMLYIGFFAMLSIFIKEMLIKERIFNVE